MDHAASRDSVAHSGGYTKKMPWLAGAPATSRCQPGQRRSSNAGRPPAPAAAHPSDRGRRSAPSPGVGPEVADLSKVTRQGATVDREGPADDVVPHHQAPRRGAAVVQLNVHGHRKIIPKARSQVHEPVIGLWWPGSYRGKGACWRLVCTSMLVTLPGC